jgi:glycosyltransferase involved in cell wall biosynthesis
LYLKNILYITYDGLTDPLGQSQVLPYIIGLSKHGYRFTILSFEKEANFIQLEEKIKTICTINFIDWKPIKFHTKPPIIAKLYDRWLMKKMAIKICKNANIAMIHSRSYPSAEVALHIKRKLNIPFLFDMRGFWADEKVDSGQWNQQKFIYKKIYSHYKKLEYQFICEAKHIISLTHAGKTELVKLYDDKNLLLENKITIIPTCADFDLFNYHKIDEQQQQVLIEKHSLQNKYVVTYSGSIGGWYLVDEMLAFFKVFKTYVPNAVFLCLTKEPVALVNSHLAKHQISANDVITTFANREDLPLYLSLGKVSIFFIRNTYSKLSSSPTKYPEIMGLGVPVICNNIGDTGKIVVETASGILLNTFDEAHFKKAIEQFLTTNFEKDYIRKKAIENFDLKNAVVKYENIYANILN